MISPCSIALIPRAADALIGAIFLLNEKETAQAIQRRAKRIPQNAAVLFHLHSLSCHIGFILDKSLNLEPIYLKDAPSHQSFFA
jgi:hypothetical protein